MDTARLQAQVRGLTRDVGALREELRQESKKKERVAAHARQVQETLAAAEGRLKQLQYVNTKLEQEARSANERAEGAVGRSRGALETLQGRLGEVERAVHSRSVDAQRQLQRLHSLVQGVQAATLPLEVAAAAAGGSPGSAATRQPALRSPSNPEGRPAALKLTAAASARPEQLHKQFSQVFAALSQLSALFTGASIEEPEPAGSLAPLLLTGLGGAKAVRWQDEQQAALPPTPAAAATAAAAASAQERVESEQLQQQVHQLQSQLAAAQQRGEAAAAAAATAGQLTAGHSGVQAAVKQLEAVVPQYRAAAQALQGHVTVLEQKLAAAGRERDTLAAEVAKWRGLAQQHEAAYAQAAAKLHSREAQALAATTQERSRTEQLHTDADGLRRQCSELGGRLREAQIELAALRESAAQKDQLSAAQQATIRQLEATINEQQEDIRSALDLVSNRGMGLGGSCSDGMGIGSGIGFCSSIGMGLAMGAMGGGEEYAPSSPGAWEAAAEPALAAPSPRAAAQSVDPLAALLEAAAAAADAATAWAGVDPAAADDYGCSSWGSGQYGAAGAGSPAPSWTIPAAGGTASSWLPAAPDTSPAKAKLAAPAGGPAAPGSPASRAPGGMAGVRNDIAGLEAELRRALAELNV